MKKIIFAIIAFLAIQESVLAQTPQVQRPLPPVSPVFDGVYIIKSTAVDRVLTVIGDEVVPVSMSTIRNPDYAKWTVKKLTTSGKNTIYQITSVATQQRLDADATRAYTHAPNDGDYQKWYIVGNSIGRRTKGFGIKSVATNKHLACSNIKIYIADALSNEPQQLWQLEKTTISGGGGTVTASVNNRVETTNSGLQYKIYIKEPLSSYKGIILLGAGNNERDPSVGDINGALENNTANELAKLGYIAAIVAYRDQPPLQSDWGNWNSNAQLLADDMSETANFLGSRYNIGRNKVIVGGLSYTTFALFTNIAYSATLADTRGMLGVCGATDADKARNFKIPVYNLLCENSPETTSGLTGAALINAISSSPIKADSGFFVDNTCNSHCGGNTTTWTAKLVAQVQKWLP